MKHKVEALLMTGAWSLFAWTMLTIAMKFQGDDFSYLHVLFYLKGILGWAVVCSLLALTYYGIRWARKKYRGL